MSSNQFTRREFVKVSGAAALAHSIPAAAQDRSKNPSELFLYVGTYTRGKSEGIYVYRMNPNSGEVKHAATVKGVSNPSFLAIDPKRRFLYAANESGEFAGRKGGGVTAFAIDPKTGDLRKLNERHSPGVPCHVSVHPSGEFAYVINELDSTLTTFAYDKAKGALTEMQTVSTLPPDFSGTNFCADIHVHPSGRFVYGSNRGHNSVVAFAIDQSAGKLNLIAHESTQGKWPRNFTIDPAGAFLLVANQNTDNVVAFRIDQQTGKLTATGQTTEIPSPVCLKFIPA